MEFEPAGLAEGSQRSQTLRLRFKNQPRPTDEEVRSRAQARDLEDLVYWA